MDRSSERVLPYFHAALFTAAGWREKDRTADCLLAHPSLSHPSDRGHKPHCSVLYLTAAESAADNPNQL